MDIDVYARDATREPTLTIVCECKHWQAAVPKNVVHGFRTVMDEAGANVGFIISANGFQSGALEAANNTNIHLVTWNEFQERFFDRWFETMRVKLAAVAVAVAGLSVPFLVLALALVWEGGVHQRAMLAVLGALALFPLGELSIQIVNALVISLLQPDLLPKLDFGKGIPPGDATLVVVPMS